LIRSGKKVFFFIAGSLSLALGIVGIFLPVLPTTPFLLLSAFCYLKSSKRVYDWLVNHKYFGEPIRNYMEHKAIKRNTKIGALIFLWVSLAVSAYFVDIWYVRIILAAVGIGVSIHILSMKTLNSKE